MEKEMLKIMEGWCDYYKKGWCDNNTLTFK